LFFAKLKGVPEECKLCLPKLCKVKQTDFHFLKFYFPFY